MYRAASGLARQLHCQFHGFQAFKLPLEKISPKKYGLTTSCLSAFGNSVTKLLKIDVSVVKRVEFYVNLTSGLSDCFRS